MRRGAIFGNVLRKGEVRLGMAGEVEGAMGKAGALMQLSLPQASDATADHRLQHFYIHFRPADIAAERSDRLSHCASLSERGIPTDIGMFVATIAIRGGFRGAVDGIVETTRQTSL
jgi:hypothetical protein